MSVFYQSEIVQIIPTGAGVPSTYLPTVQSAGISFNVPRQDIQRLGRFAPMPYRPAAQWPTFSLNVEFVPTGSDVENALGLTGPNSVIDNLSSGNFGYKQADYKVQVRDLYGDTSNKGTFNLRSGVITNYSFQASVGQIPRTSFSVEALDIGFDANSPVLPPTTSDDRPVLRPQDIETHIPTGVIGLNEVHLQSFSISIPLQRTPLLKIGEAKPFSRELQAPVIAQIQMNALLESISSTSSPSGDAAQISSLTCGSWLEDDITVRIKIPSCDGSYVGDMITYYISRPYLDNYNISNSVGGYTSVDLQFSVPLSFERASGEGNLIIY